MAKQPESSPGNYPDSGRRISRSSLQFAGGVAIAIVLGTGGLLAADLSYHGPTWQNKERSNSLPTEAETPATPKPSASAIGTERLTPSRLPRWADIFQQKVTLKP